MEVVQRKSLIVVLVTAQFVCCCAQIPMQELQWVLMIRFVSGVVGVVDYPIKVLLNVYMQGIIDDYTLAFNRPLHLSTMLVGPRHCAIMVGVLLSSLLASESATVAGHAFNPVSIPLIVVSVSLLVSALLLILLVDEDAIASKKTFFTYLDVEGNDLSASIDRPTPRVNALRRDCNADTQSRQRNFHEVSQTRKLSQPIQRQHHPIHVSRLY